MKSAALIRLFLWATVLGAATGLLFAQKKNYVTLSNRQALEMLEQVEKDIKDNYYGFDLKKRIQEARDKISAAPSQDDAFLTIAAAVSSLKDSHTRFNPPTRPYHVHYGFLVKAFGDTDCYLTAVRSGSDAEGKGLKSGDQVLSINGVPLERRNFPATEFGYRVFPRADFSSKSARRIPRRDPSLLWLPSPRARR